MQILQRNRACIAVLTTLALAGCPAQMERPDAPAQYAYRIASTPYAAAICVGRNAKAIGVAAEERTHGDSGMEVIVRGASGPFATARIQRDGSYSNVSMTVTTLVPGDRAAFAQSLIQSC